VSFEYELEAKGRISYTNIEERVAVYKWFTKLSLNKCGEAMNFLKGNSPIDSGKETDWIAIN